MDHDAEAKGMADAVTVIISTLEIIIIIFSSFLPSCFNFKVLQIKAKFHNLELSMPKLLKTSICRGWADNFGIQQFHRFLDRLYNQILGLSTIIQIFPRHSHEHVTD
jgi:hypothetical protein